MATFTIKPEMDGKIVTAEMKAKQEVCISKLREKGNLSPASMKKSRCGNLSFAMSEGFISGSMDFCHTVFNHDRSCFRLSEFIILQAQAENPLSKDYHPNQTDVEGVLLF
jgi:hypothetical protein